MGHQGIFTVENTGNDVTKNICTEAVVTVLGYNTANAVDKAHTVVSQWKKGTGIPCVMDGYSILETKTINAETNEYKIHLYVI